MPVSEDSVEAELRVGMLDMALAKLLSKQHHTIEFPTLLLPENVEPGSIVRLACTRAAEAEQVDATQFDKVQAEILESFATNLPKTPVLRARNVTQTSVVLEWDPIDIASADLRYLALYKGSQRLGLIPNALKRTSMKVSNLEIDMPYTFRLVLSSSAGDFESDVLKVQTHKMSDLSGVVVCIGSLSHSNISVADIEDTLQRLGCKPSQSDIKLDTTHFICTTEGGGQYDRAVELSIPIVRPEWLKACEAERKLVSVRGYYLSADPQTLPAFRERVITSPQPSVPEQSSTPEHSEQQPEQVRGAAQEEPESSNAKNQRVRFDVPDEERSSEENPNAEITENDHPDVTDTSTEAATVDPESKNAVAEPEQEHNAPVESVSESNSKPTSETSFEANASNEVTERTSEQSTVPSESTERDSMTESSSEPVSGDSTEPTTAQHTVREDAVETSSEPHAESPIESANDSLNADGIEVPNETVKESSDESEHAQSADAQSADEPLSETGVKSTEPTAVEPAAVEPTAAETTAAETTAADDIGSSHNATKSEQDGVSERDEESEELSRESAEDKTGSTTSTSNKAKKNKKKKKSKK